MIIIYVICISYVWILSSGLPYTHQILRQPKLYMTFLGLSVFLALILLITINYPLSTTDKVLSFTLLAPVTFMILYKFFDTLILRTYKRHLYFTNRYASNDEAQESKILDNLFQITLCAIPFIWVIVGSVIFKRN